MARSGSRTPLAGMFSGAVVVLALYALTPAFYYIPDAVLAAVVIHAVSDLASGSKYLKQLWRTSSIELIVWICAVLTTIFVDVQMGIYAAVGLSLAIMLFRFARPPVKSLTRISVKNSENLTSNELYLDKFGNKAATDVYANKKNHYIYVDEMDPNFKEHVMELPSGLLVLKVCDSILYPNAEHVSDAIVHKVKAKSRCGNNEEMNKKDSERPWNYSSASQGVNILQLPVLRAIILDFGAVCRIDSTGLENLVVVRETLDRYAGDSVEWHFTSLQNQTVRKTLLNAGFGSYKQNGHMCSSLSSAATSLVSLASANEHQAPRLSKEIFTTVSNKYSSESASDCIQQIEYAEKPRNTDVDREKQSRANGDNCGSNNSFYTPTDKYPCFHWDVDSAVRSICSRWYDQMQSSPSLST